MIRRTLIVLACLLSLCATAFTQQKGASKTVPAKEVASAGAKTAADLEAERIVKSAGPRRNRF